MDCNRDRGKFAPLDVAPDRIATICDRFRTGESVTVLQRDTGISQYTIYRLLKENSVPLHRPSRRWGEVPESRVCTDCGIEKLAGEFKWQKRGSAIALDMRCESCTREKKIARAASWRAARREHFAAANGKQCPRCGHTYPLAEDHFYRWHRRGGGYDSVCRYCIDELVLVSVRPGSVAPDNFARVDVVRARMEVLQQYSESVPLCACCGETEFLFLTLDHIQGGGNEHRRELKRSGYTFYQWLRKHGYPDGFRVLCANCNGARGYYGRCPHEYGGTATIASAAIG